MVYLRSLSNCYFRGR